MTNNMDELDTEIDAIFIELIEICAPILELFLDDGGFFTEPDIRRALALYLSDLFLEVYSDYYGAAFFAMCLKDNSGYNSDIELIAQCKEASNINADSELRSELMYLTQSTFENINEFFSTAFSSSLTRECDLYSMLQSTADSIFPTD